MSHFTEVGATHVSVLSADNLAAVLDAVRAATLVSAFGRQSVATCRRTAPRSWWMCCSISIWRHGHRRHQRRAAAMSQVMIAGNPEHPGEPPLIGEGLDCGPMPSWTSTS